MELRLDPEIPVTRVVNGHNVFNKGYHHGLRGKTYEEYYGKYNPQIEMFARFKMKSSFHKTKRII